MWESATRERSAPTWFEEVELLWRHGSTGRMGDDGTASLGLDTAHRSGDPLLDRRRHASRLVPSLAIPARASVPSMPSRKIGEHDPDELVLPRAERLLAVVAAIPTRHGTMCTVVRRRSRTTAPRRDPSHVQWRQRACRRPPGESARSRRGSPIGRVEYEVRILVDAPGGWPLRTCSCTYVQPRPPRAGPSRAPSRSLGRSIASARVRRCLLRRRVLGARRLPRRRGARVRRPLHRRAPPVPPSGLGCGHDVHGDGVRHRADRRGPSRDDRASPPPDVTGEGVRRGGPDLGRPVGPGARGRRRQPAGVRGRRRPAGAPRPPDDRDDRDPPAVLPR